MFEYVEVFRCERFVKGKLCVGVLEAALRRYVGGEFVEVGIPSTVLGQLVFAKRQAMGYDMAELCILQGQSMFGWVNGKVDKCVYTGHKDRVRHVRIRSGTIVSASWDCSLRVIRLNDHAGGARSKQVASHGGSVFGVWFDGQVAVTCSEDSTIKIWNVLEEVCVAELRGHQSAVYRVAMITREILLSCSRDFVGVWHWPSGKLLHKLRGHNHDVHRVQVSRSIIVTGSYDCTIRVWKYPSCESSWVSRPCHKGGVSCLHFEGNTLATGSAKGEVFIWDIETGLRKFAFPSRYHNDTTISCILVANERVFSTSILSLQKVDGIICIWDCVGGMLLQKVVEPFHINALKKDFGLVFCACSDGVLRVRQQGRNDFRVERELRHGEKPLYDVDVQGPRAVTCGLDKNVVVWNIHDLKSRDY
eukprot:CAMPEP_0203769660 /NCGR_PEP_ID=MMETSP0099_2-20121227/2331_1 /ASSEMBLY_ACC=CAM_ASM_000209 /TAXON_ID=96639 /ORGANISM=" , Strain NY0313808BC1" /LENGTH=417 /DNA_ID=CAMNT_0050666615 /DNA_START=170 /DNA_END=1424 /DNA_ORIENTATION=+